MQIYSIKDCLLFLGNIYTSAPLDFFGRINVGTRLFGILDSSVVFSLESRCLLSL